MEKNIPKKKKPISKGTFLFDCEYEQHGKVLTWPADKIYRKRKEKGSEDSFSCPGPKSCPM